MATILEYSETIKNVAIELESTPLVAAFDVVNAILRRHKEYGDDHAHETHVDWPETPRRQSVSDWLDGIGLLFKDNTFTLLHGRAVILGLALTDLPSGRPMVESGMFNSISIELTPSLDQALSDIGKGRLRMIPLAMAATESTRPREITYNDVIVDIALNRDGRRAAVANGFEVTVLNLTSGATLSRLTAPVTIKNVAISADDSRVVAIGNNGKVYVWPISGSEEPISVFGKDLTSTELTAISNNGARTVAVGGGNGSTVQIIDTARGAVYYNEEPNGPPVSDDVTQVVYVAPDGSDVLGYSTSGAVQLFPPPGSTQNLTSTFITGFSGISKANVLGPNGLFGMVNGSDELILMRRNGDQEELQFSVETRIKLTEQVSSNSDSSSGSNSATIPWDGELAISPNGQFVATTGSSDVTIWSVKTGMAAARIQTKGSLAFSGNGRRLLVVTDDGRFEVWEIGLDPSDVPAPVAGFLSDSTHGPDYLNIDTEVNALASIIAAKTVEPPLAIGLFGHWGSGKTFFMNRLRDRIAEISKQARESGAMQKDISFYKYVAQIEFNAWHYTGGELWAGLVEHLFTKLELYPKEPQNIVEARMQPLIDELKSVDSRLKDAENSANEAQERFDNAEKAISCLEKKHHCQLKKLEEAANRDLWSEADKTITKSSKDSFKKLLAEIGFKDLSDSAREIDESMSVARETLASGNAVFNSLSMSKGIPTRFILLIALVLAASVVGLVAGPLIEKLGSEVNSAFVGSLGGLATLLTTGATWIRSQAKWAKDSIEKLDGYAVQLRKPYEQAKIDQAEQLAQLEHQIAEIQAQLDDAKRTRSDMKQERDRIKDEIRAATPTSLLSRFIIDRANSEDYRKHLGLMTKIRRDFETISDFISVGNDLVKNFEELKDEEENADRRINRIILYIDDLDRCEPSTVISVLRAVHLLLAFPLFVVVVAVDSRWVSESLIKEYHDLLGPGESATPHDYLEKIFQIPFWLQPLSTRTSTSMIRGLVGSDVESEIPLGEVPTGINLPTGEETSENETAPDNQEGLPAQDETTPGQSASAESVKESPDLNPVGLTITRSEQEFMHEIAPILTRSPRSLKRFLNVYRLIKVRNGDSAAFLREQGAESTFKVSMLLLAIVTGLPGIATRFFELVLSDEETPNNLADIVTTLETEVQGSEHRHNNKGDRVDANGSKPDSDNEISQVNSDELAQLKAWLEDTEPTNRSLWKDVNRSTLQGLADMVARYSFRVRV